MSADKTRQVLALSGPSPPRPVRKRGVRLTAAVRSQPATGPRARKARLPFPIPFVRNRLTQRAPKNGLPGIRPDPTTVFEKGVS